MMHTRRNFIRYSAMAVAAAGIVPSLAFAPASPAETLGLQLYSVRDDMAKDPAGTLKKLAGQGYKHVEHANYVNGKFYGYSPKEFRSLLDGLGLKMPSGHTRLNAAHWDSGKKMFTDEWKQTVADAATLGQQYVISPWLEDSLRTNYDDLLRFMDVFNKSGELCKQSGMRFGYHNHDFEFSTQINGMTLYDVILEHTDPTLVIQQLDIGNMYNAGAKALDVMQKHPGRFISMHVKDEIKSEGKREPFESTILGKGILPVKEVLALGRKSGGTTLLIIEQESYQGIAPIDCADQDLRIMKQWGYK